MRNSKLETKSLKRLNIIIKKYNYKIKRLENIILESQMFNIPLSQVTLSAIEDKIDFYERERYKVIKFIKYERGN